MKYYNLKNINWDETGLLIGIDGIVYNTIKKNI